jgi:hypothetical protein
LILVDEPFSEDVLSHSRGHVLIFAPTDRFTLMIKIQRLDFQINSLRRFTRRVEG